MKQKLFLNTKKVFTKAHIFTKIHNSTKINFPQKFFLTKYMFSPQKTRSKMVQCSLKIVQKYAKRCQVVQNGPTWSKMIQYCPKLLFSFIFTTAQIGHKMSKSSKKVNMVHDYPKWSKMVQNSLNWSKPVQRERKWSKIVRHTIVQGCTDIIRVKY